MYFLTQDEGEFFVALCETIVPTGLDEKKDPGALTVGALGYIDSSLYDFPESSQAHFREAIKIVDNRSVQKFSKRFAGLKMPERDSVLRELFLNPITRESAFDLRSLVLESFYSDYHDPSYNGITAWKWLDFGGKRISDLKKDWGFVRIWKDREKSETKTD